MRQGEKWSHFRHIEGEMTIPGSAVRFGLIGFGAWGQHHAASIAKTEDAQLVAIAEPSEESRTAAHEAYPDGPASRHGLLHRSQSAPG